MYIKYSQLDTYWYIENSLDFCICKCLNSDSSRVMNLGILWVPLHRVPSPSKIAAEERLTENHHRQGLWWAYGTSNSNQKKEPGFRVMDGLWYIDICHFLSANRLLTKSVHRVNPPVSKSGDGKKNYPIDGDIVGFTSFYANIVDWLYGNIVVRLLAFKVDPIRMLFWQQNRDVLCKVKRGTDKLTAMPIRSCSSTALTYLVNGTHPRMVKSFGIIIPSWGIWSSYIFKTTKKDIVA